MPKSSRLIEGSQLVVRIAWIANRVVLVAMVTAFIFSWVFPAQFKFLFSQMSPGMDVVSAAPGLRVLLLIGITMTVATDRILVALTAIIASARAGDPFVNANAVRLQTIGWSLLVLQLLDLPGALLGKLVPSMGPVAPGVDFSVGGWIAVLMVFVLSRIFAAGAAMREDLEGTI